MMVTALFMLSPSLLRGVLTLAKDPCKAFKGANDD
jgi:hypothetical protein